ncbi:MAG TPA: LeuA family protein [Candidatus Limnocylindrales bacterium]|nr:LeuA family protein [Candidatus Limnocylindrales bacterium]
MSLKHSHLIYDWNAVPGDAFKPAGQVLLNDETLRDGLQSPSVKDPAIEQKLRILHLMEELGINSLDIGLPGAGPRAVADVERLAREIAGCRMKIKANCAARTHENDIRPIAEISQRTGIPIEVACFLGSSPIRRYTENWTDDFLLKTTEKAVSFARSLGLEVMYVTEDTSRCDPETVKRLYSTAIGYGASSIVICDTVGHATPSGAHALVRYVLHEVVRPSGQKIRVDWHGHSDRGLAVANSLAALAAGADCVHGTALGIGERVGNTQMDQMLVNLKLMGVPPWVDQDLTQLKEYCQTVSDSTGVPIPRNYPVLGEDAFRTATGVHAAAVIKAFKKGDMELANTVYSGVPAHYFGLEQIIEIGPMSGKSNVIFWLERKGIPASDELVDRIFQRAKASDRCLTDEEILGCCQSVTARN